MQHGAANVLVVEDDPLLRMTAVDIAQDAGFATLEASGADQAIAILEDRDDIRIVFTDVNMPGSMDGLELAHTVRCLWPTIQVIVTSGQIAVKPRDLPTGGLFFPKPYDPEMVTQALHRLAAA